MKVGQEAFTASGCENLEGGVFHLWVHCLLTLEYWLDPGDILMSLISLPPQYEDRPVHRAQAGLHGKEAPSMNKAPWSLEG